MPSIRSLTIKQENFCNYYVECGNASDAYRRAYSCNKMKDETVNKRSSELLKNGYITGRVNELQSELKKKSDITKEEALKVLADIVRVKVTDIISVKGNTVIVADISAIPTTMHAAIQSIKETKHGIEIRFYSKLAAIDRLSKMLGWDEPIKIDASVAPDVPLTADQAKAIIDKL